VTSPEVFYQHASFLDAAQLAKVSSSVKQQLGIGAYCDKGGFYVLEDTKH
jgi:hypothetical protein